MLSGETLQKNQLAKVDGKDRATAEFRAAMEPLPPTSAIMVMQGVKRALDIIAGEHGDGQVPHEASVQSALTPQTVESAPPDIADAKSAYHDAVAGAQVNDCKQASEPREGRRWRPHGGRIGFSRSKP